MIQIRDMYYELQRPLPYYIDALNVCLVRGHLRNAAIVGPYFESQSKKFIEIRYAELAALLATYRLSHIKISSLSEQRTGIAQPENRGLYLVYYSDYQSDVDEYLKSGDDKKLGELLSYNCAGEKIGGKYLVDFTIKNPLTGHDNSFFSQICKTITKTRIRKFESFANLLLDFFKRYLLPFHETTLTIYGRYDSSIHHQKRINPF